MKEFLIVLIMTFSGTCLNYEYKFPSLQECSLLPYLFVFILLFLYTYPQNNI